MAKRCPSCGKFLSEKDTKCSNCGAILDGSVAPKAPEKPAKVEKQVVIDSETVDVSPAPAIIREDAGPIIITKMDIIEKPVDPDFSKPSYFDGRFIQYLGWNLLGGLVTLLSLGICYPLWYGWVVKWECKHTVTCGYRQVFDGKAGSLIPRWMLWELLTILTLTIFGWWTPIRLRRWKVKRIKLVPDPKAKKYKKRK